MKRRTAAKIALVVVVAASGVIAARSILYQPSASDAAARMVRGEWEGLGAVPRSGQPATRSAVPARASTGSQRLEAGDDGSSSPTQEVEGGGQVPKEKQRSGRTEPARRRNPDAAADGGAEANAKTDIPEARPVGKQVRKPSG